MSTSNRELAGAARGVTANNKTRWGQSLIAGVFCVAFLTLLQRFVGLGRSFVICGWLPTAELGRWDLSFTFLMSIGPLLVLGVPGAFGRFADGFRKSNRILRFIQITALACAVVCAISVALLLLMRHWVSGILLGSPSELGLLYFLIPVLLLVVVFNYLTALMSSLRLHGGFAKVQTIQGLSFAGLCLITVPLFAYQAIGVVAAYGIACVISSLAAVLWLHRAISEQSLGFQSDQSPGLQRERTDSIKSEQPRDLSFWTELVVVMRAILPFACAIWLATFIANCFRVSDRLLLLHLSASESAALYLVGQYHAARIFPRLLSQFAMTLAAVITPHLAEDWDQGETLRAAQRLSSLLKFVSIFFSLISIAILLFAPMLFGLLMKDKFDLAIRLLPWSLASAVTFSLAFVLQNAFWCSKQPWWTSIAFFAGLAVNVVVGLALFPSIGIFGVVFSTYLATAITLIWMLVTATRSGFRFSSATYLLLALPSALGAGSIGCSLILIALAYAVAVPGTIVSADERETLGKLVMNRLRK